MNLETSLNELLQQLLSSPDHKSIAAEQLIPTLDLTLLDEHASTEALHQLKKDACTNQVAAICVYSKYLVQFQHVKGIELATVINFPQGNEELATSLKAIDQAKQQGATEIDYVFPYQLYLAAQKQEALNHCLAIIESCKKHQLTIKIILETGAFADMQSLYEVSKCLIEQGVDFLKTSTGKIPQGASLSAVFAMLSAIKDSGKPCGIKISGGVKTPIQASNYATLAELMMTKNIDKSWFRIGASSLLGELLTH